MSVMTGDAPERRGVTMNVISEQIIVNELAMTHKEFHCPISMPAWIRKNWYALGPPRHTTQVNAKINAITPRIT
jgi:hypothetical protein